MCMKLCFGFVSRLIWDSTFKKFQRKKVGGSQLFYTQMFKSKNLIKGNRLYEIFKTFNKSMENCYKQTQTKWKTNLLN